VSESTRLSFFLPVTFYHAAERFGLPTPVPPGKIRSPLQERLIGIAKTLRPVAKLRLGLLATPAFTEGFSAQGGNGDPE
jgi:hypothetical protein